MGLLQRFSSLFGGTASGTGTAASHDEDRPRPDDRRLLPYKHGGAVNAFALSPDGPFLAVAGGGEVDRDRRRHQIFKEHFKVVIASDVALFPAGDISSGRAEAPLFVQKGHTGPIAVLHWAEDGTLWSAGGDRCVIRHDLEHGVQTGTWQPHHDVILALLPLEREAAEEPTAPAEKRPEAAEKAEPEQTTEPSAEDSGGGEQPLSADWFLSAARAEKEKKTQGADSATPGEEADYGGATHVLSIGADRYARLTNLRTRKVESELELGKHLLVRAAFVGGDSFAVTNADGLLRVVDVATLEPRGEAKFDEPIYSIAPRRAGGFWTGDRLGLIRRHAPDGSVEAEFRPIEGARILSLAESPDGGRLALGNIRGEVAEVDAATHEAARALEPLHGRATAMAYLPGGELIAGDYNGYLYLLG